MIDIDIHMRELDKSTELLSSAHTVVTRRCRLYVVGNLVTARLGVVAQHIAAARERKQVGVRTCCKQTCTQAHPLLEAANSR